MAMGELFANKNEANDACEAIKKCLEDRVKAHFDAAKASIDRLASQSDGDEVHWTVETFSALGNFVIGLIEAFVVFVMNIVDMLKEFFHLDEQFGNLMKSLGT